MGETTAWAYDQLMGSLVAKIRKWFGLEKKPVDAPKQGTGAP
jgi:hypothetical protein